MAEFLSALRNEIRWIEAELRSDPRFRKWESLRSVLSLYESSGRAESDFEENGSRSVQRSPSEARAKALELARLFLRNRSGPTPTREIYDHIITNGGELGGKDPISNLSAMLSNSEEFQSNGRAGWTLAPEDGQEPISEETFKSVSAAVITDLSADEVQETYSYITSNRKIPQDIDGHLLAAARERVGRFLTDRESATLRAVFTSVLNAHVFA